MGSYFFTIKNEDIEKLMLFLKPRKKSKFINEAIVFYLKNKKEDEIRKFVNPFFLKEFEQLLKKIKERRKKWKRFC